MNINSGLRRQLKRERRSKPDTDVVGIDQSLSNCAMVHLNGTLVVDREVFHTGCTNTKMYQDKMKRGDKIFGEFFEEHEMQVAYLTNQVVQKIAKWNPKRVCLEGLSFGSTGKVERQLAGLYFSIISALHYQLGYNIQNKDIITVVPAQAKKIGREFLPKDEWYLKEYTSKGKPKLRPMDKKDMIRGVQQAGYGYALEGYTRSSLVASRNTPTGLEDLPDAICIGLFHLKSSGYIK